MTRVISFCAVALTIAAVLAAATATRAPPAAPPVSGGLALNPDTMTISGISAGGAFAVQFSVAFSALVRGTGVVAGIPYQCAEATVALALSCMSNPELIDVPALIYYAQNLEALSLIDPLANVATQAVTLFSGTLDTVVAPGTMAKVQLMYEQLGVTNMVAMFNTSAEHAWITNNGFGNVCSTLGSPYINDCNVDFARATLQRSFDALGVKWNGTRGVTRAERIFAVDQTAYGASPLINSLATVGYAYVPAQCEAGSGVQCHLHVAFHGCNQYAELVGLDFVQHSGLNSWAESNNIVVLYPQAVANDLFLNDNGCFNWWAYLGPEDVNYATREGIQMNIVRQMILGVGGF